MDIISVISSDYISIVLSIITTLCAVVQFIFEFPFNEDFVKASYGLEDTSQGEDYDLDDRFVIRSWVILILFSVSIIASVFLWIIPQKYDYIIYVSYICPLVSFVLLVLYAAMAKKSFDTDTIIAPRGLWEVLFNKIPSYVDNSESSCRIILTQIGDISGCEHVLDSVCTKNKSGLNQTKNKNGGNEIRTTSLSKCAQVLELKCQQDKYDTPLYKFELYPNISQIPVSMESDMLIHGIIVFIGISDSYSSITQKLKKLASKVPYVPIAYYSFTNYPIRTSSLPYTRLNDKQPNEFVNYLIFRHYARSLYWKRLCDRYHQYMKVVLSALFICVIGVTIWSLLNRNLSQTPLPAVSTKPNLDVRLTNVFFEKDSPARVKVWKSDSTRTKAKNIFNSGDAGVKSDFPDDNSSMVWDVLKAQVACLWVPKDFLPLTIWDKNGKRINANYLRKEKLLLFGVGDSACSVKWHPNPQKISSLEDERIRIMYSFDGYYAVEVAYDPTEYYSLYRKLLHSNSYLAKLQQYLVAFEILDKNGLLSAERNTGNRPKETDSVQ